MHFDSSGVSDDNGPDLEELCPDRPALFAGPVASLETKATQSVHQDVGQGAHDEAMLVRPPAMARGAVCKEIELLFFDAVFHITARTVDPVIKGVGVSSKIGDEVTRVASFGSVLGFTNHEPCPIPRPGLVVKPGKETLFFAGALERDFGLVQSWLKEAGDAVVAGESDKVVDVIVLAPPKHAPTAKSGVGSKDDFDFGPSFAKSFDQDFEDGPSSAGTVGVGGAEQGAKRVTPAKNIEREEAVATVVVVVGGALLTSVNEVVGGVEVEDEFAWWRVVTLDKEVDEQVVHAHRAVSIGPLLHTTEGGRTCKG